MLGDAESVDDLAAVYRRLYPSLVRTAFLLVDTREQAEEVEQEAFAKAFPKWERLSAPDAYVRTCVVNDADVTAASALLERFGVGGFDTWAPDLVTAAVPAGVTAVLVVGANGPLPWRP